MMEASSSPSTASAGFAIRPAAPADLEAIVRLIHGLAEFEKLTHLVQVTPESLAPHLFGAAAGRRGAGRRARRPRRRVRALLHQLLDLPRPARPLPRGPVRRAGRARPGHRPGAARAPRAARGDARLRPLRMERARLERRRDPLLPAHGRDGDARLAHLPDRRPGARRVPERRRVTEPVDRYAELHAGFRWHVPADFNIAEVCCTRWARERPDAVAIRFEAEDGARTDFTYGELDRDADRLAAALRRPRRRARRPRRARPAAALRDRGRAHRALSARRRGDAAVDAVRPRRARVPHQRQRGAARDRRRERHRQRDRGAAALPEAGDGDRGRRGRRAGRRRLDARARRASARRSSPKRRAPTTRPCSSTPAARPARRRAR